MPSFFQRIAIDRFRSGSIDPRWVQYAKQRLSVDPWKQQAIERAEAKINAAFGGQSLTDEAA